MIIIKEPAELQKFINASVKGNVGLVVVEGTGGLGKSYRIKQALKGTNHLMLSSHLTPASLYSKLYEYRDLPVFINDIDKLFSNNTTLALFKQLTETEEEKTIQYNSKSPLMADLPSQFTTTSTVILDCNGLPSKAHKDFKALMTRGVHILYVPSNETMLQELKAFAKDKEILNWFSKRITRLKSLDLRKYVVAKQLKKSKLDWENYLYQEIYDDEFTVIEQIGFLKTYKDRTQLWTKMTGKGARTYDRVLKRYKQGGRSEKIRYEKENEIHVSKT